MHQHERRTCPLRLVECKWGCGTTTLLAQEQEEHQNEECLEAIVQCDFGCRTRNLKRRDVIIHQVTCPERPAPCPLGGECTVPHSQLKVRFACRVMSIAAFCLYSLFDMGCNTNETHQVHALRDCPERTVWCQWNCKTAGLKAKDQLHHETAFAVCPNRKVPCRLGCGVMTIGRTVKHHEEKECRRCIVLCPHAGCARAIDQREVKIEDHQEVCAHRPVVCEACDMELTFAQLEQHLELECPQRRKPCPHGCGEIVLGLRLVEVQ